MQTSLDAHRLVVSRTAAFIAGVHRANSLCCGLIGVFGASLLLYMILYHTPRSFHCYRRILLIGAVTNVYIICCDLFVQTRYKIEAAMIIHEYTGRWHDRESLRLDRRSRLQVPQRFSTSTASVQLRVCIIRVCR